MCEGNSATAAFMGTPSLGERRFAPADEATETADEEDEEELLEEDEEGALPEPLPDVPLDDIPPAIEEEVEEEEEEEEEEEDDDDDLGFKVVGNTME